MTYRIFGHISRGACILLLLACGHDSPMAPDILGPGEVVSRTGPQTISIPGGSGGSEYVVVVVNTSLVSSNTESYDMVGTQLVAPGVLTSRTDGVRLTRMPVTEAADDAVPRRDELFERRIRIRERSDLTSRIGAAREWYQARTTAPTIGAEVAGSPAMASARRTGALPSNTRVGDIVTLNVNANDPCSNATYRGARVVAVGTHAIVLADTLNPAGGFTSTDYQRYAARFDTLVFPLDSAAFGAPTDIDGNGHVGLIFSRAVNELTPRNADAYVGGFTFSRDLFPTTGTTRIEGCAGSNQGEFFYLLAPDPTGVVNGNRRTAGFVDSNTTAVIAHEFQHLINASRRIYVNNANALEDIWLDEGLAHTAEELLFYRESGTTPKSNLDSPQILASQQRRTAFNLDMSGNAGRYRSFLLATSSSSPYAPNDSLTTRGATWSLLRFLADGSGKSDFYYRLVNATSTGIDNLKAVHGSGFETAVRDWSASHAVDDLAAGAGTLQQPSWNWHSIYTTLQGTYPLAIPALIDGGSRTGQIVAGGAAFARFGVKPNETASIAVSAPSSTAATNLQIVIVRTK